MKYYCLLIVSLSLGSLDNLLSNCSGAVLVANEAELIGAATLGDLADKGGKVSHLSHGDLSLNYLNAVTCGVHAHNSAAALVYLAHNVAHVAVGHCSLKRADGLKERRHSVGDTVLISQRSGCLEGHFRGVNGVVGTVVQGSLDTNGGIAREHALVDCFAQTLFNSGEEVLGNRAADYALCKLEAVGIIRLELDPNVAELAVTAGLLLVTTLSADLLADGLASRGKRSSASGAWRRCCICS